MQLNFRIRKKAEQTLKCETSDRYIYDIMPSHTTLISITHHIFHQFQFFFLIFSFSFSNRPRTFDKCWYEVQFACRQLQNQYYAKNSVNFIILSGFFLSSSCCWYFFFYFDSFSIRTSYQLWHKIISKIDRSENCYCPLDKF